MLYKFVQVVLKALLTLLFRIKAVGKENVIDDGVILAANHKSNWDPLCIIATCPRQLASMSKKELFKFKPLGWILKKVGAFPVNRGKGDIGAVKTALAILKQEHAMMMFPEGRRILDGTRGEAKAGVAMLAHRAQVPVLPIKICGKFRLFSKITVIYGEPVYFDEYYGEKLSV
jgi:1-acyl-sn-glycerol-3-phosphate acyltransferase